MLNDNKVNANALELESVIKTEFEAEVTKILYASVTKSLVTSLVLVLLIAYVFSGLIATTALIAWALMLVITYVVRHAFAIIRSRQTLKLSEHQWLTIFRLSTAACGAAWGLSGVLLFNTQDIMYQVFLASCLAGVCAGGIIVYSVEKITSLCFTCCLLLVSTPTFFMHGSHIAYVIAIMLVMFAVYSTLAGLGGAKAYRDSIKIRIASMYANKEIKSLSQRQKLHIENTPLAVIEWDANLNICAWNAAAEAVFGYSAQEAVGKHGLFLMPQQQNTQVDLRADQLIQTISLNSAENEILRKDGKLIHCAWFNTPIKDKHDQLIGFASLVQDKTAAKEAQDEILRLAYFDTLTNLPNRRLLDDRLKQAIATSKRSKKLGCVMYIDLDNFKALNDSKGHSIGDLLLKEVAKRLQKIVRGNDTVARIGGDEFVLILNDLGADTEQATINAGALADKIIAEINQPYMLNGHHHHCSPSAGICLYLGDTLSSEELLKRADSSMYLVKKEGRNNFKLFDEAMLPKIDLRANLKNDLCQAIAKSELALHYQVQVNAAKIPSGAEALLRWKHPVYGMVSPAEFIPLAEESGQIIPIGTWVLQQACHQLKAWSQSTETDHLKLSVNVSALQFSQADFVATVTEAIQKSGCRANLLILELTESTILHNIEEVIVKMLALKKLGVWLSMDDFGVGYSSFSALKRLPLDELKIDQSFIQDSLDNTTNATIVKSIIDLGKNIGLKVVAEGVETELQARFLRSCYCTVFQGHLFGKPVSIEAFNLAIKQSSLPKPLPHALVGNESGARLKGAMLAN